jgi:hypothetical protein
MEELQAEWNSNFDEFNKQIYYLSYQRINNSEQSEFIKQALEIYRDWSEQDDSLKTTTFNYNNLTLPIEYLCNRTINNQEANQDVIDIHLLAYDLRKTFKKFVSNRNSFHQNFGLIRDNFTKGVQKLEASSLDIKSLSIKHWLKF